MRRNPEVISKVMEKREIVGIFRRMALFGRIAAGRGAVRASVGALLAHAALRPSPCMAFAVPGEPLSEPSRSGGADDAASSEVAGRDARPLVLVAEDNAGNYRLIEVILRSAYRLQHALNGQEAVEMFDRERPDIVLMDINMPVMDGYEALPDPRARHEGAGDRPYGLCLRLRPAEDARMRFRLLHDQADQRGRYQGADRIPTP